MICLKTLTNTRKVREFKLTYALLTWGVVFERFQKTYRLDGKFPIYYIHSNFNRKIYLESFFELISRHFFRKRSGVAEASEAMLREGYAILEALKPPLTDIYGQEVDYECGPVADHIRNTIDDLVERKKRNDELCDVRKLKLQQILQLRSCERDADQVRIAFPILFCINVLLRKGKITLGIFFKRRMSFFCELFVQKIKNFAPPALGRKCFIFQKKFK